MHYVASTLALVALLLLRPPLVPLRLCSPNFYISCLCVNLCPVTSRTISCCRNSWTFPSSPQSFPLQHLSLAFSQVKLKLDQTDVEQSLLKMELVSHLRKNRHPVLVSSGLSRALDVTVVRLALHLVRLALFSGCQPATCLRLCPCDVMHTSLTSVTFYQQPMATYPRSSS